jgi:outer membrane protein OmpA-like peptidoglycan-associated protein
MTSAAPIKQAAAALWARPRLRRGVQVFVALFVAIGLFGFFVAPGLIKSALLEQLGQTLHRPVQIEAIAVNPYTLTATVRGLSIKSPDGAREVAGFGALRLNISATSLWHRAPVIDAIQLDDLRLHVQRLPDGRYDISDLLDEWLKPSTEPAAPTPSFAVHNISITASRLEFEDQQRQRNEVISDLQLRLPFVSNLPHDVDTEVQPYLALKLNGAPFELKGETKPFAADRESTLHIDIDGLDLPGWLAYSPTPLPVKAASGKLDTRLTLTFRSGNEAALALAGTATLRDLRLTDAGGAPLLAFTSLQVPVTKADLLKQHFDIGEIVWQAPEIAARVDAKGHLNWLQLAPAKPTKPQATTATLASTAPAPQWRVAGLQIADGKLLWHDESTGKPVDASVDQLQFKVGPVAGDFKEAIAIDANAALQAGDRLKLQQLAVHDTHISLAEHRIEVGNIALQGGQIGIQRNPDGVEVIPPPRLAGSGGSKTQGASGPAWQYHLGKLTIDNLKARLDDRALNPAATQTLALDHLEIEDFGSAPGKRAKLQLAAHINDKGSLTAQGEIAPAPLQADLKFDLQGLQLLPLQPYFEPFLNISVTRGNLTTHGRVQLAQKTQGLAGSFQGDLAVQDFLANDQINGDKFLGWKKLDIGGIDARLGPDSLTVRSIALNQYYARVIISPKGRLNLLDIANKQATAEAAAAAPATASEAPSSAAPVPAPASATIATTAPAAPPMPIRIDNITLRQGNILFSDRFVKPNYTAAIGDVSGQIKGLSSAADSLAELSLRGSYNKTAPVSVDAKLNALSQKRFLDLKGEVRGVELTTLTTYSARYAGYDITKGKLSLFVTYKLENNQLSAENRVFLDQLTFGDKVEGPDAPNLPVKLAVALLQNSRGEIDVNLPVSGSLDDPKFSLGGIIVKVILNIFVKAVTSPFALIGSMFGGSGEELSQVDFESGQARLGDEASQRLDKIAKALNDRPALKLEITGHTDPATDVAGLKQARLERAVRAEKVKAITRKGQESDIDNMQVSAAEYPVYLEKVYSAADFKKPRNMVGLQKKLAVADMEQLIRDNTQIGDDDLRQLAQRRAQATQTWLIDQGKVPVERLFLLPPKIAPADKQGVSGSAAVFSLHN